MPNQSNPAVEAAKRSLEMLYSALDNKNNFIFEAGAGAGKTYSLIKALEYLIERNGKRFLKLHQKIACITYTNVAKVEIDRRVDKHPAVHSDTIHAFCWSIIRNFQEEIRKLLPSLSERWPERIKEYYESVSLETSSDEKIESVEKVEINLIEILGKKEVSYQLGYPSITDHEITLYHDDVLNLMVQLLNKEKFRKIVFSKYPIILIDEYQDTFAPFADSLQTHFINPKTGPQIGFFGDHWQRIYGSGVGKIVNDKLFFIPKNANFRSVSSVVHILNHMRPELTQEVEDPASTGMTKAYHTNSWSGIRRTGAHWGGDLPAQQAHDYLTFVISDLEGNGWDFRPEKTKILMLTHNILAEEQGYRQLANVFSDSNSDSFLKKDDKYISYFTDYLEPICDAYTKKKFGEMFSIVGAGRNGISAHSEKVAWGQTLHRIMELRESGTIGEIIDYLLEYSKPRLPENIEISEKERREYIPKDGIEEPPKITRINKLRLVPYKEIIALTKFLNDHTPFATNHGVKGEEYENVLLVVGRGWNQYNFDQMLKWFKEGIPAGKEETFERSRNLFYVACSRPKKNLAILFTQLLSPSTIELLDSWFSTHNVVALKPAL